MRSDAIWGQLCEITPSRNIRWPDVCSQHLFGLPLRIYGLHRMQLDHMQLDLLSLVIWSRIFWPSVMWNLRKAQCWKCFYLWSLLPTLRNLWLFLVLNLVVSWGLLAKTNAAVNMHCIKYTIDKQCSLNVSCFSTLINRKFMLIVKVQERNGSLGRFGLVKTVACVSTT